MKNRGISEKFISDLKAGTLYPVLEAVCTMILFALKSGIITSTFITVVVT